jgi:predicted pyridoxine 5'-phosphate oxidase superfamily flavin-nucleotide-binding protein
VAHQSSVDVTTVDDEGWPDVSYKGGDAGFVRVIDEHTLLLPSYDGNGMSRTLGHVAANGRVSLLFVDASVPWRLRVQGTGEVIVDPDSVAGVHGAQALLRVHVRRVFPNCDRYLHAGGKISPSVPRRDHEPPVPDWKQLEAFADVLPEG